MRYVLVKTAFAVAVLVSSTAFAQVTVYVYSSTKGGESNAEARGVSESGARVDASSFAMSQRGGRATSDVNARASRGARINAAAEAVTKSGIAKARNRTIGKGNADVDGYATAESLRGKAVANVKAKGVAKSNGYARVLADSFVRGKGKSNVEAISKAARRGKSDARAIGVVERYSRPGSVKQRVEAFADRDGRSTSRGEAYDFD